MCEIDIDVDVDAEEHLNKGCKDGIKYSCLPEWLAWTYSIFSHCLIVNSVCLVAYSQ